MKQCYIHSALIVWFLVDMSYKIVFTILLLLLLLFFVVRCVDNRLRTLLGEPRVLFCFFRFFVLFFFCYCVNVALTQGKVWTQYLPKAVSLYFENLVVLV